MTSVVAFKMMGSLEKGTPHVWVSLLALYLALSLGICLDKSLSVCRTNYPDKSTWGEQINSTETQQKHCLHKLIPGSVLAPMPTPSSLRRLGKFYWIITRSLGTFETPKCLSPNGEVKGGTGPLRWHLYGLQWFEIEAKTNGLSQSGL